jgi:16S rRNA (cytosine1402-N4)-methyltransferase
MPDPGHVPVLEEDTLRLLDPQPGETAVDLTVGRGGHSLRLARAVTPGGRVYGFDLDGDALEFAGRRLEAEGLAFTPIHDSFVRAPYHLRTLGVRADVVLADLGFNSVQMDDPDRGFSFSRPGPLDMRFDRRQPVSAADLVATLGVNELADLIDRYGEEPLAAPIARKVVQAREVEPIQTTTRLAELVVEAYGRRARTSRMHPATRTFMALRIAVNDELTALRCLLDQIADGVGQGVGHVGDESWLRPRARVAIISFHSLEDRMVKRSFKDLVDRELAVILTRRPVMASEEQRHANPRARSARLRAVSVGKGQDGRPDDQV